MSTLETAAYVLGAAVFVVTALWARWHKTAPGTVRRVIILAAMGGAGWLTAQGVLDGMAEPRAGGVLATHLPLYAAAGLAAVLAHVSGHVLAAGGPRQGWYWLTALGLLMLAMLDLAGGMGGDTTGGQLSSAGWARTTAAGLILIWAAFMAHVVGRTLRVYRRATQPLHRNRLAFWAMAAAALAAGEGMLWLGLTAAGAVSLAVSLALASLAALEVRLPDARRAIYDGWRTAVWTILAIVANAVALGGLAAWAGLRVSLPLVLAGAGVVVLVVSPALNWLRARRRGESGDPRQIVAAYGNHIRDIVDLELLAQVSLGQMQALFGVDRAALYVVAGEVADDENIVRLIGAGSLSHETPRAGSLLADGSLAKCLGSELAPVTQYALDVEDRFAGLSRAERVWLGQLNMDVFMPIHATRQWIGLFALGPKKSRHQYFAADLQLLTALADQTAVALQNARLVSDLVRVNADLHSAYAALDAANRRLSQLERAKSDFINIISHELRTPLAILFGYAQILMDELGQPGQGENRQLAEGMTTGVTRLKQIIEDMLDMAKIDSRALQVAAQPVHLEPIVQKLVWQLQWTLNERNLALQSSGLADTPPVEGDAELIYKALHHLVTNAIKYTPNGGTISICSSALPEAQPPGIEIRVSDTGIGIDPRFLELIFDKFYQTGDVAQHSSGASKFKGGGPGLGLAIARGIAEAHGGSLHAESPGHDEHNLPGSHFILRLPQRQVDGKAD